MLFFSLSAFVLVIFNFIFLLLLLVCVVLVLFSFFVGVVPAVEQLGEEGAVAEHGLDLLLAFGFLHHDGTGRRSRRYVAVIFVHGKEESQLL